MFTLFVNFFIVHHVNSTFIGCVRYADDVILLCPSIWDFHHVLDICFDTVSFIFLEFNASKSYCLAMRNMSKLDIQAMTE